jgi:hypothetical protein
MTATSQKPITETLDDQPSVEERRALIDRVAASEQFSRSARLREFLLYVGGQSLKEGRPEIHEQEIGAKVFGRSSTYDRSQDNIVRVNATELRKRIELYFTSDGAHESLILEIPRGGYKPIFHRRAAESDHPHGAASQTLESPRPRSADVQTISALRETHGDLVRIHVIWATLCLLLVLAGVLLFVHDRNTAKAASPWEGKPAVAAFWSGFLRFNQRTDIVLPDDSVSVIEDVTHRPIALGDYLTREYMRQIQTSGMSLDRKADLDQIFAHNLVTFGGVRAAQKILDGIPPPYERYLTMTRSYTADEMKRDNVVLVGGKKSVPWDHLFDDKLNFITDYDYEQGQQFVSNRNPKPGEQAIYTVSHEPNSLVGYSVVAFLPNPSQTGNAIILAGTDSDATTAAAEFLTSEDQLERFRNTLPSKQFPYFEVLLKTSRLSGTSFNAEMVAYRIYPGLR